MALCRAPGGRGVRGPPGRAAGRGLGFEGAGLSAECDRDGPRGREGARGFRATREFGVRCVGRREPLAEKRHGHSHTSSHVWRMDLAVVGSGGPGRPPAGAPACVY